MRFTDADPSTPLIRKLTLAVDEGRCTLRWLWPERVEAVYVERLELDMMSDDRTGEEPAQGKLKLYTREEYKASNGYTDRITGFGAIKYTVYVCQMEEEGPVLIRQRDEDNMVIASAGRRISAFPFATRAVFSETKKCIDHRHSGSTCSKGSPLLCSQTGRGSAE